MKLKKWQFEQAKVRYFSHVMGQGVTEPDCEKVAADMGYPVPTCQKEVKAFIG